MNDIVDSINSISASINVLSVSESVYKCISSVSVSVSQFLGSNGRIQSSATNYPDHGCLHSGKLPEVENSDSWEDCRGWGDWREMYQHPHWRLPGSLPALLARQGRVRDIRDILQSHWLMTHCRGWAWCRCWTRHQLTISSGATTSMTWRTRTWWRERRNTRESGSTLTCRAMRATRTPHVRSEYLESKIHEIMFHEL